MLSKVLFDTNVLVFFLDSASDNHLKAKELVEAVLNGETVLYLSVQNLNECLRVILSHRLVIRPLSYREALEKIEKIEKIAYVIYPTSDSYLQHKKLLKKYPVKSADLYDNFLVATMLSYGLQTIYTHNAKDFKIYKEIEVVNPFQNTNER